MKLHRSKSISSNRNKIRVPYALAVYGKEEINAAMDVLKNPTKISVGEKTKEFEKRIAKIFGKKYGVMVNSGSSANLLALKLLRLPRGSEIITPILTFSTTVAPIIQLDLTPVFVDAKIGTYQIDASKIEGVITKRTRAIMVPSLIGNIPDLKKIQAIAKKHKLFFIEDSCDTLGATFLGKPTGAYSDITTTSFYASHIITGAGGGGMLCFNKPEWLKRSIILREWGRESSFFGAHEKSEGLEKRFHARVAGIVYDAKFIFSEIGYNFQPLELSAAFALAQLKKLKSFSEVRQRNFAALTAFFKKYEKFFILPQQNVATKTNWLAYPLTIKKTAPFRRLEIVKYLEKNNVQTRPVLTGNITKQPGFKNVRHGTPGSKYPAADYIMENSFLVGCHHGLTEKHINHLEETFSAFLSRFQ